MVKKLFFLAIVSVSFLFANDSIRLKFSTNDNVSPLLLVKLIELGLERSNARIAFVNEFLANDPFIYSVDVWKDNGLNLNPLNDLLVSSGVKILKTDRYENGIDITLSISVINLALNDIKFGEDVILDRSNLAYFINIGGVRRVDVMPKEAGQWIPLVRVYDSNLNQIDSIEKQEPTPQLSINLGRGSKYALVSDNIDINNIRGGLILKFYKE